MFDSFDLDNLSYEEYEEILSCRDYNPAKSIAIWMSLMDSVVVRHESKTLIIDSIDDPKVIEECLENIIKNSDRFVVAYLSFSRTPYLDFLVLKKAGVLEVLKESPLYLSLEDRLSVISR